MSASWLVVAAVGLVTVVASVLAARRDDIPECEQRAFRAVNGLPDGLYWALWVPMQVGNLVVGTAAGLAVAWWQHDLRIAVGVVAAMVLKLVTEKVVRREMQDYLGVRQRPGTSEPVVSVRGDVPHQGPSFPSGHVILVAAVACLVTPPLPGGWVWVPFALTLLVIVGRIYVGAHNPLDTTAGLGTGLLLGGVLSAIFH
jgi:undecaprenyl-diphosphatase